MNMSSSSSDFSQVAITATSKTEIEAVEKFIREILFALARNSQQHQSMNPAIPWPIKALESHISKMEPLLGISVSEDFAQIH